MSSSPPSTMVLSQVSLKRTDEWKGCNEIVDLVEEWCPYLLHRYLESHEIQHLVGAIEEILFQNNVPVHEDMIFNQLNILKAFLVCIRQTWAKDVDEHYLLTSWCDTFQELLVYADRVTNKESFLGEVFGDQFSIDNSLRYMCFLLRYMTLGAEDEEFTFIYPSGLTIAKKAPLNGERHADYVYRDMDGYDLFMCQDFGLGPSAVLALPANGNPRLIDIRCVWTPRRPPFRSIQSIVESCSEILETKRDPHLTIQVVCWLRNAGPEYTEEECLQAQSGVDAIYLDHFELNKLFNKRHNSVEIALVYNETNNGTVVTYRVFDDEHAI